MSLYSSEPNNLAQQTEGFECGLDVNEKLHMLSDYEEENVTEKKNVLEPVVEEPVVLDDSIYDEPSPVENHVTFEDKSTESDIEEFSTGSVFSSIKDYAMQGIEFAKSNWLMLIVVVLAIVFAYLYFSGRLSGKSSGYFNLADLNASSSFKASSSSLGSNFVNSRK